MLFYKLLFKRDPKKKAHLDTLQFYANNDRGAVKQAMDWAATLDAEIAKITRIDSNGKAEVWK